MAHVHHRDEIEAVDLHDGNSVLHVRKQVLVGPEQGAERFVLRLFTIGPGGSTPHHSHPWEHEVYVLAGEGRLVAGQESPLRPGHAVFVAPGEVHHFENAGDAPLEFLCIVPLEGER
jgi:quercetin dioxygenase-like cupin family protein